LLTTGAARAAGFRRKAKGESIGEKRTRLEKTALVYPALSSCPSAAGTSARLSATIGTISINVLNKKTPLIQIFREKGSGLTLHGCVLVLPETVRPVNRQLGW
jgi:hypothetical protein